MSMLQQRFASLGLAFVAALALLFVGVGSASAATAKDRCLFISTPYDSTSFVLSTTQGCGASGRYHIQMYDYATAFRFDRNTPDFSYGGGNLYGQHGTGGVVFPRGSTFCAKLWFHEPNGRYTDYGNPCIGI